jgi:hypothetical protein
VARWSINQSLATGEAVEAPVSGAEIGGISAGDTQVAVEASVSGAEISEFLQATRLPLQGELSQMSGTWSSMPWLRLRFASSP